MEEEHSKKVKQYEYTISRYKRTIKEKKKSLRYIISTLFLFFFSAYYLGEDYLYSFFGSRIGYIKFLTITFIICALAYSIGLFFYLKKIKANSKKLNEKIYHLMKLKKEID